MNANVKILFIIGMIAVIIIGIWAIRTQTFENSSDAALLDNI